MSEKKTYTYLERLAAMNKGFRDAADARKKSVIEFAGLPGTQARIDSYVQKLEQVIATDHSNGLTLTDPVNIRELITNTIDKIEGTLVKLGYTLGTAESAESADVPQISAEELEQKLPELFAQFVQWYEAQHGGSAGGAPIEKMSHYMGW